MSLKDINETVFQIKMLYFPPRRGVILIFFTLRPRLFLEAHFSASTCSLSAGAPNANADKLEEINCSSANIRLRSEWWGCCWQRSLKSEWRCRRQHKTLERKNRLKAQTMIFQIIRYFPVDTSINSECSPLTTFTAALMIVKQLKSVFSI